MHLPFVDIDLPDDLRAAVGDREHVMVGMRPERFEDATLVEPEKASHGVTFDAAVDVVEWLGNEQYAYVPFDAPDTRIAGLEDIVEDLGTERGQSQIVVALDPASTITDNSKASIWFDPRQMHVFDADTGANLALKVPAPA